LNFTSCGVHTVSPKICFNDVINTLRGKNPYLIENHDEQLSTHTIVTTDDRNRN